MVNPSTRGPFPTVSPTFFAAAVLAVTLPGCVGSDFSFDTVESVGDRLLVTQGRFDPVPLETEEMWESGWSESHSCLPGIGHQFVQVDDDGWASPLVLVYDGRGRLLGTKIESRAPQHGPLWEYLPSGQPGRPFPHWAQYTYFRDPEGACLATSAPAVPGSLGDRMTLSRELPLEVPLRMDDAWDRGWDTLGVTPDCVPDMGIHMVPPVSDGALPGVIGLYDAAGDLIGYELGSLEEQPTPPWEHHDHGLDADHEEFWTLHLYVRDPLTACTL